LAICFYSLIVCVPPSLSRTTKKAIALLNRLTPWSIGLKEERKAVINYGKAKIQQGHLDAVAKAWSKLTQSLL